MLGRLILSVAGVAWSDNSKLLYFATIGSLLKASPSCAETIQLQGLAMKDPSTSPQGSRVGTVLHDSLGGSTILFSCAVAAALLLWRARQKHDVLGGVIVVVMFDLVVMQS